MSFFSKISRALGFDNGNDDFLEESESELTITSGDDAQHPAQTDVTAVEGLVEVPVMPTIDKDMKAKIFEGVVEIFNRSLPDFLARSVDPAAQRRLLCEALDKSVDDYLNGLMLTAEQYAEGKLRVAMENSHRESEKLKNEMAQLEQQRTSLRESQLSADRRRRALAERVTDLESKLAAAEAEREQFDLENKSLINKLKVADVQPGVVEDMAQEIERLKAALADKGSAVNIDTTQITAANARIKELETTIEGLNEQQKMSQAMYNDLQEKYAAEREARNTAEKSLEEAKGMFAEIEQLQSQFGQIEEIIAKRDEIIEKLKASNRRLRDECKELRQKIEDADATLFSPAPSDEAPMPVAPEVISEMAAIEDDFECPDWFVADPGPGLTPLHSEDPNFGYQEPAPKPRRLESDAQLSLF